VSAFSSQATPYASDNYRRYVLGVLTLSYAVNFIDRQLISILQESIKLDLGLSDTQLGLLTGFAFAMFYVTAGIPLARFSDRGNRRNIVAYAIGTWSFMTALCGAASSYIHLLLARIGVGIGESGGTPPAHSMISDIYPEEKRGTAMAIYSVGINIGIMFGFLFGGLINEHLGWRWAFAIVGFPGLLLALLIKKTVAEPSRSVAAEAVKQDALTDVIALIPRSPVIRQFFLAVAIFSIGGYGAINWLGTYFIRGHALGSAAVGTWLSLSIGVVGGIGTYITGLLADKWGRHNRAWYMWIPALAAAVMVPFYSVIFTTDNTSLALYLNLVPSLFLAVYIGPGVAILHSNVASHQRATISALFYFVINIVGLGLGPTIIGAISDALSTTLGKGSIGQAMLYVIPTAFAWASLHFFLAGRALTRQPKETSG
jgi:predicted MFS family arabinose efflux permease